MSDVVSNYGTANQRQRRFLDLANKKPAELLHFFIIERRRELYYLAALLHCQERQ